MKMHHRSQTVKSKLKILLNKIIFSIFFSNIINTA
jgi:hypothetical protein